MAYSISYKTIGKMKYPSYKPRRKRVFPWVIAVILIAGALSFRPIRHLLLPDRPAVTEKALSILVEDIKAGESISSAITTFCQTILDDGK